MTIENLVKVIPPPRDPIYAYDDGWDLYERVVHTPLPIDYKELMRLYGAGSFMEFFDICGPRSPTVPGKLEHVVSAAAIEFIQDIQGGFLFDDPPLPIWPRLGGLFACGWTWSGNYIFWLTRGLVSEWPIVIWDRNRQTLEHFEYDLTDFLAGVATGNIRSEIFPAEKSWPKDTLTFQPALRQSWADYYTDE